MESPRYFEERRKYPRYSIRLPLEYWQTDDGARGGLLGNLSEGGLLAHSVQDMPVGMELNVRIFFPNEYEFDSIRISGRIVWKDYRYEVDWKGYQYGIEFIQIFEEDREKLINLLRSPSLLEEVHTTEGTEAKNPPPEESISSPIPGVDSQMMKKTNRHCLWNRFKTKILHVS